MIFFAKKEKKDKEFQEKKQSVLRENKEKSFEIPKSINKEDQTYSRFLLCCPHITEKTALLSSRNNQYVFQVMPQANKTEIKKAVQSLYRVAVKGVRIINVPAKRKRIKGLEGWERGYKKAIVTLKPGQKIEIVSR